MKTRRVVYFGLLLALFAALEYVSKYIGVLDMPNGGSISLAIIPLLVGSYLFGVKDGILLGVLSVAVQALITQIYYVSFIQFLLDYIIGFGVYGIAVLFPSEFKVGGHRLVLYTGIVVTAVLRFLSSTASGVFYYGLTWWGSAVYNFGYIFATMLICMIFVPIVVRRLKHLSIDLNK